MSSKKLRHDVSSDDSEDSDASRKSDSSSDSNTDDSSTSERRHKKKKKHATSSDSDSDSEDQRRVKKRKHKKKKKKHGKKKRRAESDVSQSDGSAESEGEIPSKKKRKHKHKNKNKRASVPTESDKEHSGEGRQERRIHSVVKERRGSIEDSPPSRTYYQKEYHHHQSATGDHYEREKEVQRFYRGTSKERSKTHDKGDYEYIRENPERYHEDKYAKSRERYPSHANYTTGSANDYRRQKEYEEYKRRSRYEAMHGHGDEYQRRPRGEYTREAPEEQRGYKQPQYESRGPPRSRPVDEREYRERRGPPDDRFPKEPYRKDKYREEGHYTDRGRDVRRERPVRVDRPPPREYSRSASPERKRPEYPERVERSRERYRGEREERDHRRDRSPQPKERKSRFANTDDNKEYSWGKTEVKKEANTDKEKPNFGLSGKLTADANTVNGVVIKYTEPDDAKQPKRRWRFYPFKGDKALPILYIHRQSCFVMGRDKKVVDIHLEHPSISKQHAALQYRATPFTRADGSQGRRVRPYIIDLESANGTFVNNKKIEPRRYNELLERDVVKFGFSAREYVLLHENSKDDAQDDDNQENMGIGANVTTTEQIKHEKRAKEADIADGD